MNTEKKNGHGPTPAENIPSHLKKKVEEEFSDGHGYKLNPDVVNIWSSADLLLQGRGLQALQPLEHYADYFRKKYPEEADYQIYLSDPEAIAAFDKVIDEFNADLERIKKEGDEETAKQFFQKGIELTREKK